MTSVSGIGLIGEGIYPFKGSESSRTSPFIKLLEDCSGTIVASVAREAVDGYVDVNPFSIFGGGVTLISAGSGISISSSSWSASAMKFPVLGFMTSVGACSPLAF